MRFLKYLALLSILLVPAAYSHAQIGVGVGVAPYADGGYPYAPPACSYGYYPYAPYACAPYGYYGPEWYSGGIFIGAGPWFRGGYYGRGYGYAGRGGYAYGRGPERGYPGGVRGYQGGGARGYTAPVTRGSMGGGAHFSGGGGAAHFSGGGGRGGGGRR